MKKNIFILLAGLACSLTFGQGKYGDIYTSKKLAYEYADLKDKDRDDFYQQYYWLVKAEQLKSYPHLANIKPVVLYNFVKEINPQTPTKSLSAEDQQLRKNAAHALNQYFQKKDLSNPLVMSNLESYVDPGRSVYYSEVNPERIAELVPKQLYTFTSSNKKNKTSKTYYLWIDDDKYRIVDVVPPTADSKFYTALNSKIPNYKFSQFPPEVKRGNKNDKKDAAYYYVTPFADANDYIEYRTDDFRTFELTRYKDRNGVWQDAIPAKK